MKKSKAGGSPSRGGGGGGLVVLVLVFVVGVVGVALSGLGGVPSSEAGQVRVFDTRWVPLKVSFSGDEPKIEQEARFAVLVGKSRKQATWVRVNPWRYVACDAGDAWLDGACVKVRTASVPVAWSTRSVTLVSLGAAMALLALLWASGGRRERV